MHWSEQIPGIGRVTEQLLGVLGVNVCGDIVRNIAMISALLTPSLIDFCLNVGLGLGQTTHPLPSADDDPGRKGISCERTFKTMSKKQELEDMVGPDLGTVYKMRPLLFSLLFWVFITRLPKRAHSIFMQASLLVTHLCHDMASEGLEGRTITFKMKLVSFEIRTRAATLSGFASKPDEMLPVIIRYINKTSLQIRLLEYVHFWPTFADTELPKLIVFSASIHM